MNHPDRNPSPMPGAHTELVPAPAASHEIDHVAALHAASPSTSKRITAKLIVRAVGRHWWQAALLWLVGSLGLMTLAYLKVKPTYIAVARVRVEQERAGLFGTGGDTQFAEFKETQVKIITQPTIIETAISAHPDLLKLPRLREAADPNLEISLALSVAIVRGTNLIDVSMVSESSYEATSIVNAVVDAYLKSASDTTDSEKKKWIDSLKATGEDKKREVAQNREAIRDLVAKGVEANVQDVKNQRSVTIEQYSRLHDELTRVEIEIAKAETRLAELQNAHQASPGVAAEDPKALEREVAALFEAQPKVIDARAKYDQAAERWRKVRQNIRDLSDPALVSLNAQMTDAKKQLDSLWVKMEPRLILQARSSVNRPGGGGSQTLQEAEGQLHSLQTEQQMLTDKLNNLKIRKKDEGSDQLALEFHREDLRVNQEHLQIINRRLADLEFESKNNPIGRVKPEFRATQTPRASTSNRLKIMAVAPVGMMFGVLCLLVLMELHAGRVVDPEEIPSRIRVPVIGVVPPLPQVRSATGVFSARDEFRAQRQLDQFVQSLDHLRVALCSSRNVWGRDLRVILITSACGSEGKTTLAAQLAERCVNAGLHTLLIDGDLRNPTLSRMLDVPTNRGLINVLRGEVNPDEAIGVVGGAGGFSFMPAGTPKVDPSRLLHGERLGKLLAQARESFDIVIVDAPPVLPVPDALTIGRWADGAVLAVRYDTSRFPLVEKANRRLAAVGVPVIGAVVNGVRVAESTYGSYYPSYAYSNERASQSPLDV